MHPLFVGKSRAAECSSAGRLHGYADVDEGSVTGLSCVPVGLLSPDICFIPTDDYNAPPCLVYCDAWICI